MGHILFVLMGEWVVPAANAEDNDDVVVALETARVSEESGDLEGAAKWLHRGAAAARHQGRPERAGSLSRTAAQLVRAFGKFEPKPEEEQVLCDIDDDDFSEKTIVETTAQIAAKGAADEARMKARAERSRAQAKVRKTASEKSSTVIVEKPTPVAPLAGQPVAAAHQAIRVAVKKTLSGKFEARPLSGGESPAAGEHEALLVPTQGGSKLS